MAKPRQIKQFVVGTGPNADFSPDYIEALTLRLALWYGSEKCDRAFEDPEAAAKETVKQCLLGETKDGKPWQNAPHEFAKRIKVKAAYDMEKGEGIPIQSAKHPSATRRLDPAAAEGAKLVDEMQPAISDFDIEEHRRQLERTLLAQYPELDNAAHFPHVRRLSLLYAQQEMIDRELMIGVKPARRESIMKEMDSLAKTIDVTLKTLDIHPDSIRKKIKENSEGSLGDLVATLDADEEFPRREKLWTLQEMLQLWYMCNHPNGEGTGPQISEIEMWHMTRTRPFSFTCQCGRHYPHIVQGFTPKQLRDYLVKEGVLVEVPVIPQLIEESSLEGIHEFIDALPEVTQPEGENDTPAE